MRFAAAVAIVSVLPAQDQLQKKIAEMSAQARVEAIEFREAGGKPGAARDPALKWAAALWSLREQHPGTPAAASAAAASLLWLRYADRDEDVLAKAEQLPPRDPAWANVIADVRDSARKTKQFARFLKMAQSVLDAAKDPPLRAPIRLAIGRCWLDQNQPEKAKASFEAILRESPRSEHAKQADRSIYEITALSNGKPAPLFAAKTVNGAPFALADYRGKVVLLNFWATW